MARNALMLHITGSGEDLLLRIKRKSRKFFVWQNLVAYDAQPPRLGKHDGHHFSWSMEVLSGVSDVRVPYMGLISNQRGNMCQGEYDVESVKVHHCQNFTKSHASFYPPLRR